MTGQETRRDDALRHDPLLGEEREPGKGKIVKGEGIVGLTRAFMFAGSPRVICSLWRVDDEATQALMVKFDELWNPEDGEGLGAAEALKKAQEYIRSQKKWKHPSYWAAWVLWGLPDQVRNGTRWRARTTTNRFHRPPR